LVCAAARAIVNRELIPGLQNAARDGQSHIAQPNKANLQPSLRFICHGLLSSIGYLIHCSLRMWRARKQPCGQTEFKNNRAGVWVLNGAVSDHEEQPDF